MVLKTVLELQPKPSTLLELRPTLQRLASQRRLQRRSLLLDIANQNNVQGPCTSDSTNSLKIAHGEWPISSTEERSDDNDSDNDSLSLEKDVDASKS